jgi:hypothetical protein
MNARREKKKKRKIIKTRQEEKKQINDYLSYMSYANGGAAGPDC